MGLWDVTTIPLVFNGREVRVRGFAESDVDTGALTGAVKFRNAMSYADVVDRAGLGPGRFVVTYTSSKGTRTLVPGDVVAIDDLESGAAFSVTLAP